MGAIGLPYRDYRAPRRGVTVTEMDAPAFCSESEVRSPKSSVSEIPYRDFQNAKAYIVEPPNFPIGNLSVRTPNFALI